MRISLIEDYGPYIAGHEYDLPADEAKAIIEKGYAYAVGEPLKEAPKVKKAAKK